MMASNYLTHINNLTFELFLTMEYCIRNHVLALSLITSQGYILYEILSSRHMCKNKVLYVAGKRS